MDPIFLFTINRISMAFLLVYLYLYTARMFSRKITIICMFVTYALTTGADAARYMGDPNSTSLAVMCTVLNISFVLLTSFFLSRYRDFRALLTGLMSNAYAMFGDVIALYCYIQTGDVVITIVVQVSIHVIVMTSYHALTHTDYMEILHENDNYWSMLCVFPIIYWLSVYAFTYWPNSLAKNPETFPGIALYLAVIFYTAIVIVKYSASDKKRSLRTSNMAFLGKYLDRINAEKDSLFMQYGDLETINRELQKIVSNMNDAIEDEDMDKLKNDVARLDELSQRKVDRSFCGIDSINAVLLEADDIARDLGIRFRCDIDIMIDLGEMEMDYSEAVLVLAKKAVREAAVTGGHVVNLEIYLTGSEIALSLLYPIFIPENVDPRDYSKRYVQEYNRIFEKPDMVSFINKYKAYYGVRAKGNFMAIDFYVNAPIE